jgi:hypothetical protein
MKKMIRGGAAWPAASAARPWRNGCRTVAPAPSEIPLMTDRRSSLSGVTIVGLIERKEDLIIMAPCDSLTQRIVVRPCIDSSDNFESY